MRDFLELLRDESSANRSPKKCKFHARQSSTDFTNMSTIFYKFKIAKDYNSIKFDGTGLSVFDIKKEIMTAKKLGKGQDFDLILINPNTDEGSMCPDV